MDPEKELKNLRKALEQKEHHERAFQEALAYQLGLQLFPGTTWGVFIVSGGGWTYAPNEADREVVSERLKPFAEYFRALPTVGELQIGRGKEVTFQWGRQRLDVHTPREVRYSFTTDASLLQKLVEGWMLMCGATIDRDAEGRREFQMAQAANAARMERLLEDQKRIEAVLARMRTPVAGVSPQYTIPAENMLKMIGTGDVLWQGALDMLGLDPPTSPRGS